MMNRRNLIAWSLLLLFGGAVNVSAQQTDTIRMSRVLDSVSIVSQRVHHVNEANAGAKVARIDPQVLHANRTRSLAELLTDHSAIYIKSLGMGALSTASFRGASASQTRVNWNGINVTPPMSGTFDFSQIPVFFTDNISLYYGNSHAKGGTGAVGGSVNLFTDPTWNEQVSGKTLVEYGSFHTYTAGGMVSVGGMHGNFKTRLFYQHSDNDYTYENRVMSNDVFREKRQDARYSQMGFMQEAYFRLSPRARLTAIAWYQANERELPQPLGIVNQTHEEQKEEHFRGYIGLDWSKGIHDLHVKAAWLYYRQTYDMHYESDWFDPKGNRNRSNTFQGIADYTFSPCKTLIVNSAFTVSRDLIRVSSYLDVDSSNYVVDGTEYEIPEVEAPFKHHRNIFSWQISLQWYPREWLLLNGQYLFERNDRRNVSTWSAGAVANLWNKMLQLKGSVGYNYRFPSMNDLYWRPGGNPDVLPEEGHAYDASLVFRKQLASFLYLNTEVSGYLMYIDNWILWLPKDGNQWIWTPQNKRNVRSEGIELYGKMTFALGDWESSLTGNFTWSRSRTRTKQHADDGSYMKQIPYVPRFKWNLRWATDYKRAFFAWQLTYIGRRFITTDQSYATDPYAIHNLVAGYRHEFKNGMTITPQIRVDNLFDAYYESTQYYPMPLRNCLFSLLFEL